METNKTRQDEILSAMGLKRHMVWQAPQFSVYDSSKFKSCISIKYCGP